MYRKLILAMTCCVLVACATRKDMALEDDTESVDTSKESIVLVALDIFRSDDSRYTPEPEYLFVNKLSGLDKKELIRFSLDSDDAAKQEGRDVLLASMALAPGQYSLDSIDGEARGFPFRGFFEVPIHQNFTVKPGNITYIGHITAKLRPRQGNEFRAGPVIPLIDQAVTGLSGGTWDTTIDDMSAKDIPSYRAAFPVLSPIAIQTDSLPAFDRAAVQHWWESE